MTSWNICRRAIQKALVPQVNWFLIGSTVLWEVKRILASAQIAWSDQCLAGRLKFFCSFHYLQVKESFIITFFRYFKSIGEFSKFGHLKLRALLARKFSTEELQANKVRFITIIFKRLNFLICRHSSASSAP
jgi:hypothetical protein